VGLVLSPSQRPKHQPGGIPVKGLLIIAALLLAAVPARADTIAVIVDIIENPLNPPIGNTAWDLAAAYDNADPYAVQVDVVGYGPFVSPITNASAYSYYVVGVTYVAAVPEPTTWAMLLTGFALLGGWRWRSRHSVQKN
jgi:hypothetical protein